MGEQEGIEAAANRSGVPVESDARYYEGQDLEALATLPAYQGVLPWFFLGRVRRIREFSPRWAGLYDRLVVPIAKTIEGYFKPPLGKNLLCIARARESNGSTR